MADFEHAYDYSDGQVALVRGEAAQTVPHTRSRRSGPRRWRRAVEWLIAAGLHPRASATTLRVAHDLADRMDYDTGHVRYGLKAMAARLGMSVANLKKHVAYLRELGALVWTEERGSQKNILRALGRPGFARTATVYAAVIPPCYDHAMGHTIVGSGYQARIIIDQRCQTSAETPAEPSEPVDNPPVDNPGPEGLEPPSLTWVEEEGKLKVVGGSNYISQARRDDESPTHPTKHSSRPTGLKGSTGRTPLQAAQDIRIAAKVRPLVPWTQREKLRPLAVALRPLIDEGLDYFAIAVRLNNMGPGEKWRPRRPAAYIATVLTQRAAASQRVAEAAERFEVENPVEGAFQATHTQQHAFHAALEAGLARLHRNATANGWADLAHQAAANLPAHTDADAAADMAAFLTGASA